MGRGTGAGVSRYNGLRVELTVTPQTGTGLLTVTRKHWRDGWDCWTRIAPLQRFGTVSVTSDTEALEAMYAAVGQMLDAARAGDL